LILFLLVTSLYAIYMHCECDLRTFSFANRETISESKYDFHAKLLNIHYS